MTHKRTFEEWFNKVKAHHEAIEICEEKAKEIIDDFMLHFFETNGVTFQIIDNKWDPVNRYVLPPGEYPNFRINYTPTYKIDPYDLTVTFSWWKTKNKHYTQIIWDPRKETLQEVYDRKLEKVFKLI